MSEGQRERLLEELAEVLMRLLKLEAFMDTIGFGKLPPEDIGLLNDQLYYMRAYCRVLASRVARHVDPPLDGNVRGTYTGDVDTSYPKTGR